jgi:hypothetical protein
MKRKAARSYLRNPLLLPLLVLVRLYELWKKLCWYLSEKRLKWQRLEFYNSLDLVSKVHFAHDVSPFLRNIELDAAIFAFTGEIDKLRECLNQGVSPDLRGLMENAMFADHARVVRLLLAFRADSNRTVDLAGNTLLHEATVRGNPEIVEMLLAKGADPNRPTRDGTKALVYAYDRSKGRAPLTKLLEPVTEVERLDYDVDDFLKMENPEKAYWALHAAIQKHGLRKLAPAELRVLSLADFTGNCLTNGFTTFDGNARWAIVPSAELMDAIDEPAFARELWQCIAIMREYGQKIEHDPLDHDADYVALDEATENKLSEREFDFTAHCDLLTDERLYRKTMDYVRKNRSSFLKPSP